jgi:hypothetical protein
MLTKIEKKPLAILFKEINQANDGHITKEEVSNAF